MKMLSRCLILLIALVAPARAQAQTPASPAPIWHADVRAADTAADPTLVEEYRQARLDYESGLYGSATQRLEYVIAQDQTFVRAFDNLGLCYDARNDAKQALRYYREAVRLNRLAARRSPWPPFNLGVFLHRTGRLVDAEPMLKEALDVLLQEQNVQMNMSWHTDMSRVYYQLGTLLEHRFRFGEAYNTLKLAAREDPNYLEPEEELARMPVRAKSLAQAAATLHP
jgi:tetratricopeptide (TPR) repeat protein